MRMSDTNTVPRRVTPRTNNLNESEISTGCHIAVNEDRGSRYARDLGKCFFTLFFYLF